MGVTPTKRPPPPFQVPWANCDVGMAVLSERSEGDSVGVQEEPGIGEMVKGHRVYYLYL